MILKWSKKLIEPKTIEIDDFAKAFGTSREEVSDFCGEHIENRNFTYNILPQEERESLFLNAIKKCDNKEFKISGPDRKFDWSQGWREILEKFNGSGQDLRLLIPKDIHPDRPLRYNGDYIVSNSHSFEYDFTFIFRNWLFKKYFCDYENIYEFGCGSGHNLAVLATIFGNKKFFGGDWVSEPREILRSISQKYGWDMQGFQFDFFDPDYNFEILPNSLVYTSAALEQVGKEHQKFVDFLLAKKPALCVNVECIGEYYNENSLFDYVALKYHKSRNYLEGFLTYLRTLEKENKIKIIATKRLEFGSLYHEVNSYVVWKPI